jgi:hypothetical protein
MKLDDSIMSKVKSVWIVAVCFWIFFSLISCVTYPVMMSDSVARYAPMAEAFAEGDWNLAFHPRFGVLFQVLSGCVVKVTGLDGARSLQIVGFGFLSLSVVPIWCITRRLFGVRVAWLSVILVFFGDDFFRYALDGLRDSGKCLAFALLGLGVVERNSLWYGIGLFILISLASYCFAVGTVFLFVWCVYACIRSNWRIVVLPVLCWLAATVSVTVMVHSYTGHWLPAPNYIRYIGHWL